jgi:site-specific recombinase XerC
MMDSTWPPPFGTAAVSGLPPFDRDRSLRRTAVAQWLAHVPDGVPSVETVKTFADQLATRVKGRSAHRYLFSLRDVLEHLFPEADLGSALPRRLDRVFPTLPFDDWPEVARSDLSRAKASMNPRTWQTGKEAAAKYFALDSAPWPPTRESVRMFRTHLLAHRKAATARAYLTCLHTALAAAHAKEDWTWMLEAFRDLGRRRAQPRRSGHYSRRIRGLPIESWPQEWQAAWHALLQKETPVPHATAGLNGSDFLHDLGLTETAGYERAAPYASATLEIWRRALGQLFGVLAQLEHPLVLNREAIGVWADAERPHLEPITFATRLSAVLQASQALFPHLDWEWLRNLARAGYNLAPDKGAWSPRHADRLVGAGRLRQSALAALVQTTRKPLTLGNATAFRDALIVLLLTHEPLRRRDLAKLPVTCLEWRDDNSVRLRSMTSKNHQDVDRLFTGNVADYLRLWVGRHRPTLLAGSDRETACLFVGRAGAPLTAGNLTRLVRTWTRAQLGQALSPHDVRGAVAYTVVAHGGDIVAASTLLRDRDSQVVERHYAGVAGQIRASRALDETIEATGRDPAAEQVTRPTDRPTKNTK